MKFFKFGLMAVFLSVFVVACTQSTTTTTTNTATNSKTITQNVNGTTVQYEAANSNANSAPQAATDELAGAKKIYKEKCILCHKETGEGGEVDIEGDKLKVPSFKNEKVAALEDAKYKRVIEEGDDKMPAFKSKLKPEEIDGLIKMIRKDFQGK